MTTSGWVKSTSTWAPGVGHAEQPVARVDHGDEIEVRRGVDGRADLLAHPSARAEDTNPDRLGHGPAPSDLTVV